MVRHVAAFTDTYLPTVNGVTYTVASWRECWEDRGGRMDVVYPESDGHVPADGEHPVRSLPFPFYDGYRLAVPSAPAAVRDADVVHAHTPFSLGLAARRTANSRDHPFVASYHTPAGEYTKYLVSRARVAGGLKRAAERYERWFFDAADVAVAPSEATRRHLLDDVGVDAPVEVVSNGVDVRRFRPVDSAAFLDRHDLPTDRPLVGYTGRHGYEKRLVDVVDAVADLDVTLVFGGDGPARASLERRAAEAGVDAHFLGFLDREELPAFYSALDVFAFPSPIETQGLVALEANACGTPVVGVDEGALADTVVEGETGYHFSTGDPASLRAAVERALADRARLRETCLDRRAEISLERALDRLEAVYDRAASLA